MLHCAEPSLFSANAGPDAIRLSRIPTRHVNPVCHVRNRNFGSGPTWEQRLEYPTADFAMQSTDTVHTPTATNRQVGHVERLHLVFWIRAPKLEQSLQR